MKRDNQFTSSPNVDKTISMKDGCTVQWKAIIDKKYRLQGLLIYFMHPE